MHMLTERRVQFSQPTLAQFASSCVMGDGLHGINPEDLEYTIVIPGYETLNEEIGPVQIKGSTRRTWNPIQHYKCYRASSGGKGSYHYHATNVLEPHIFRGWVSNSRFGCTGFAPAGYPDSPFGEPALPIEGLPPFRYVGVDGDFIPPPADIGALESRACQAMLPIIKAELSSINTLLELKDFKSLPKTVLSIGKLASSFVVKLKTKVKPTLRNLLHGTADGYLQAKFNILPLLSDITGIHAALVSTERRINDLISQAGRIQNKHFAYVWKEYAMQNDTKGGYIGTNLLSYPANAFVMYRNVTYDDTVFHAQMQYNYNYTAYQREHAHLLALLDAFGVNFNPAIIWNAIPWSFVVDWVIGVGRFLDSLKKTNMEPQINIRKYLWSVKRKRTIRLTREIERIFYVYPIDSARDPLPEVIETAYRRHSGYPSIGSITSSGLSPSEISLGAALVTTRSRHHRTRR